MDIERARIFRPAAEPRVIENAYTADQHDRLLDVVRRNGPWTLILSQHFKSAEELIATTSGMVPEGVTPTLDMFLSPVFRGYFSYGGVCIRPEIEDCFYNTKFLGLVRDYWKAEYAEPEGMLFNIQGPCSRRRRAARRCHALSRHGPGQHADLAHEHHGQVGPVQALAGAQGAGRHLVLPRQCRRRLRLLAGRPACAAPGAGGADVGPRRGGRERDDVPHGADQRPGGHAQTRRPRAQLRDGGRSGRAGRLAHHHRRQGDTADPGRGIPLPRALGRQRLHGPRGAQAARATTPTTSRTRWPSTS